MTHTILKLLAIITAITVVTTLPTLVEAIDCMSKGSAMATEQNSLRLRGLEQHKPLSTS